MRYSTEQREENQKCGREKGNVKAHVIIIDTNQLTKDNAHYKNQYWTHLMFFLLSWSYP
jgi:hypothetical protein